jgi:hypothetical protein
VAGTAVTPLVLMGRLACKHRARVGVGRDPLKWNAANPAPLSGGTARQASVPGLGINVEKGGEPDHGHSGVEDDGSSGVHGVSGLTKASSATAGEKARAPRQTLTRLSLPRLAGMPPALRAGKRKAGFTIFWIR